LDCLAGLAALADENGYVKPIVDDSDCLILQAARHPVVELSIGRENYIPNDTYMKGDEKRFALITGPNMAGKSTYMRQVALAVIMARIGSYIPAAAGHIGKIDRIFTRVGASDDLSAGQSTFMVEMSETSNIIRNATRDSLIILDEIGRGTSTYDGLSIAWAVSEYILRPELSAKTLFATHYHELIELAASYGQVQNYSVAVREKGGSIVFLRKIVEGGTDKSYGVHVAKLAGLPQVIIDRANDILQQLETDKSERTNISGFLREQVQEETKPAENPLLDEIRGLDLDNLRPMEALLYIEKWQKELRND
jgi:DNA mismatch repair protein MutS